MSDRVVNDYTIEPSADLRGANLRGADLRPSSVWAADADLIARVALEPRDTPQ